MKKTLRLITVAGLLLTFSAKAIPQNFSDKAIGVAAGSISGSGFTFRYLPSGKVGFQVTFLGWNLEEEHFISVGAEPLYVISEGEKQRVYVLAGMALYSQKNANGNSGSFNVGIGAGLEYYNTPRFATGLELVTVYHSNGDILPLPQLSLLYYF